MAFGDWAALIEYAEKHTKIMPVVLRTLVLDPASVDPRDLADELDHLWDTGPPEAIKLIIAGVLVHLGENGVKLSALNEPKPRKRKRKRARGAR